MVMKEVSSRFGMVTVATAEAENVLNHNDTNTNGAVGQKRKPNNDDENPSTSTTLARPSYRRRMRDERIIMSAAEAMNPARRCTMEDVCVLRPAGEWDCPDESVTYVGVYDGHGGREMVEFLKHGMHYHVAQEMRAAAAAAAVEDKDDTTATPKNDTARTRMMMMMQPAVLECAFLMADIHAQLAGIQSSGATVAVCLIRVDVATSTVHITAANVGDSRIVLGRRNRRNNKQKPFQPQAASTTKTETSAAAAELPVDDSNNKDKENNSNTATVDGYRRFSSSSSAIRLSADHRVHDPLEVARIEQAGGFLFKGRVCGVLAVTRSLGDFIFKRYVIAHPHVSRTEISTTQLPCCPNNTDMDENDNGDQFVIVACDGLWDVMTDEEAVAIVFEYCAVSRDPDEMKHKRKTAADHLVTLSLQRGTSDNVTVVVVWL